MKRPASAAGWTVWGDKTKEEVDVSMKAAIYARYSSNLQSPSSIEDQISLCRAAAERMGHTVAAVFEDRETSGATDNRAGYLRLMDAAKRGEFDVVIVEAQDRLWRNQAEMHRALDILRFRGVRVLLADGTDLTDPKTGSIVATISGLKDEFFLQDLKDKTRRGMAGRIGRKLSAGGAPFGYRGEPIYDESRKDIYGRPEIVGVRKVVYEPEARVVRRIFEMYAAGSSPRRIAFRLNEEHVPPPRPKREQKARGWTWTTISGWARHGTGILNNEVYIGRVYWNRSAKMRNPESGKRVTRRRPREEWLLEESPDLRIVSDDLWKAVKARQAAEGRTRRGGAWKPPSWLFSGLLICAECGGRYTLQDKRGWLRCSTHFNRGPAVCRNRRMIRKDAIEKRLLAEVEREILTPENVAYLTRRLEESLARAASQDASARKAIEAELREAEQELENIKGFIRKGTSTDTTAAMLTETEARIQRRRADLAAEPAAKATIRALPGLVERYARDLRAVLHTDVEQARHMLGNLLGPLTVIPEGGHLVVEFQPNLGAVSGVCNGAGRGI